MFKFELGITLKDIVTGFKGIVMSRIEYLTGCNQYGICPKNLNKDGNPRDWQYFDEHRLQIVDAKPIKLANKISEKDGADGNLPPCRN